MFIKRLSLVLLLAAATFGQSIVTPMFIHKDGYASVSGYSGSGKDILVNGGALQSVCWLTFQTIGIDVSKVASARLVLYVKTLEAPGTLGVYPLTAAITAPENNCPLSSLPIGTVAAATVGMGTADIEKVVSLDITTLVKAGSFYGVALSSDDGLMASFDAKEGRLAPVILLTHDVESVAAKWLSGTGIII